MNTEFTTLASTYAGFLAALGGVSITVLTLVLALKEPPGGSILYPSLVASLIVATVACFVGAHLMAETTSISKDLHTGVPRLFMIASVNIYLSAALFLYALMLLPRVYDTNIPHGVKHIAFWTFAWIGMGSFVWMATSVLNVGHKDSKLILSLTLIGALLLLVIYLVVNRSGRQRADGFLQAPLWTCLVIVGALLLFYHLTRNLNSEPRLIDLLVFSGGVAVPCSLILAAGIVEYRGELRRNTSNRSGN